MNFMFKFAKFVILFVPLFVNIIQYHKIQIVKLFVFGKQRESINAIKNLPVMIDRILF